MKDYINERGAKILAREIERYWERHGRQVQTRIEVLAGTRTKGNPLSHAVYCIRSNLVLRAAP